MEKLELLELYEIGTVQERIVPTGMRKYLTGEQMAEMFIEAIDQMQKFVHKHPAPFIAKVYRDGRITPWKDSRMLLEELN